MENCYILFFKFHSSLANDGDFVKCLPPYHVLSSIYSVDNWSVGLRPLAIILQGILSLRERTMIHSKPKAREINHKVLDDSKGADVK